MVSLLSLMQAVLLGGSCSGFCAQTDFSEWDGNSWKAGDTEGNV